MNETLTPQVLVVGGGPGGYVAAIRAGQLGLDTILVEADRLGGTCLVRGCIPSKALIHAADLFAESRHAAEGGRFGVHVEAPRLAFDETIAWKDGIVDRLSGGVAALLRKARVRVVSGWATFSDAKTCSVATADGSVRIRPEHVILATGSVSSGLPLLPLGDRVIASTEALALESVPRQLAVVGAGYIGLELGIAFAKMGAQVAVVEFRDRILPAYDAKLTDPVKRWLENNGVALHLNARAMGMVSEGLEVALAGDTRTVIPADKVLVTVGRRPNTEGWGLDAMQLEQDGSFVKIDDRCATSTTNVWAIGDLVGEPMLAHKASAQGEMVAEIIAGARRQFRPVAVPAVCFTEPEIVRVGLSPEDVPAGTAAIVGQFPFAANGRALSMGSGDDGGFVRVVAQKEGHRILGIQGVGRHVSELAGEFTALVEMGAVLEDVAGIIHTHPTLGEAVHEASLKALGHAIHV